MKDLHGLPTVTRIVDELDGSYLSYLGTSLYELTMQHMQWIPEGHHVTSKEGESLAFHSPWNKAGVRGEFRVFYFDKYPKKCIPTWTEYEVEIRESPSASMLIKSRTARNKTGAIIRLYRKDGYCVYPLLGHPTAAILYGELSRRLDEYQAARFEPSLEPYPRLPQFQESHDGLVYLCHMALACAVKWQSHSMDIFPGLVHLPAILEQRLKETVVYDQKVKVPPNAA